MKKSLATVFIFFVIGVLLLFWSLPPSPEHLHFKGNAMTIDYHIVVRAQEGDAETLSKIIDETFQEVDRIYNNWNPQSEVSALNRIKAGVEMSLSKDLETFLLRTQEIVHLTEGRFDPTVDPLRKLWHGALEKGAVPSQQEIDDLMPAVGWHHLHLENGKVIKDSDRTSLDLGGVAKGYAVDLLVQRIEDTGFPNVLVEWGGEVLAHGKHSQERPWQVFIGKLDDMNPETAIAQLQLNNQALATSGDYIQQWTVDNGEKPTTYFHIIDPRTGQALKATEHSIASASVLAPSCMLADALAKAAIMHSTLSEGEAWSGKMQEQHPGWRFWLFAGEGCTGEDSNL